MSRYEQIGLPVIDWGLTLCWEKGCAELAECAFDGYPYCLTHAEDAWEQEVARELNPELAAVLLEARE